MHGAPSITMTKNTYHLSHNKTKNFAPHATFMPLQQPNRPTGNLLLNRSLSSKVGDVGLSRLMPGAAARRTAGGSPLAGGGAPVSTVMDSRLVGTPCYMDPEYLRTGRFGPKSDVYSLGEWGGWVGKG